MRAAGAKEAKARKYLPHLQAVCEEYSINTPQRVAGFLSQIGHESAGFAVLTENLNYNVNALLTKFGRHRISEVDARRFGRATGQRANKEAIANTLYGGEWGRINLGNTLPGDGWRFRGRGLKQATGRDNYRRCGIALGVDFITHPDRLALPVNATRSAGWFWGANDLNRLADLGNVRAMTRAINGGAIGLEQRTALYNAGLEALT